MATAGLSASTPASGRTASTTLGGTSAPARRKGVTSRLSRTDLRSPEDYLENGSLWEHLGQGNVSFRNYGEGFEFAGVDEGEPHSRSGAIEPINFPVPKVLYDNTCWEFPIFNTNIPDIARADWMFEDIKANFRDKGKPLPQFLNVAICNDHGTSPRPKEGYPYVSSYMADNDLALGRIIEYLSHTPEWKSMAIFVTQDDPGGDNDHVDRCRSFVMAIGPYVKHGYVSHDHTSIMSIVRSIYDIYGLGPSNMFDALATPLDDMFTDKPDFAPYNSVNSDPRVFIAERTFDPDDPTFTKRRKLQGVAMDDPAFIKWMEQKGAAALTLRLGILLDCQRIWRPAILPSTPAHQPPTELPNVSGSRRN